MEATPWKKPFTTITVVILAVVALLHALRLLFDWSVTVEGTAVPGWVSVVGLIVSAGLAVRTWREKYVNPPATRSHMLVKPAGIFSTMVVGSVS